MIAVAFEAGLADREAGLMGGRGCQLPQHGRVRGVLRGGKYRPAGGDCGKRRDSAAGQRRRLAVTGGEEQELPLGAPGGYGDVPGAFRARVMRDGRLGPVIEVAAWRPRPSGREETPLPPSCVSRLSDMA